ncbi:MAG: TetR/AcrR family transcriptional regulator [Vicingaceae bacterium]|nr:TetR/AcrR family transcriptional regulator [Vicingaceae bacterium]
MNQILSNINIKVNENLYLKNPESSVLGKKILKEGIPLIDELGFDDFTFKKLAKVIKSTEASIYRYFENKHKFLLYLTSWYWAWMEYKLLFATTNIECPKDRLNRTIKLLTEEVIEDGNIPHINERLLSHILIAESSKAYSTKMVDDENNIGAFASYKQLVQRISDIVIEINPNYKYPHMLISTIIEGSHHQRFFSEHLPKLTDVLEGEDAITSFYTELTIQTISNNY